MQFWATKLHFILLRIGGLAIAKFEQTTTMKTTSTRKAFANIDEKEQCFPQAPNKHEKNKQR